MWAGGGGDGGGVAPLPPNLTGFWSDALCPQDSPLRDKRELGIQSQDDAVRPRQQNPVPTSVLF